MKWDRLRSGLYWRLSMAREALLPRWRYCPVCDKPVHRFRPISPRFREMQTKYGSRFTPQDAEFCNASAYTCPHCQATDRARLMVWYLEEQLGHDVPPQGLDILEFAPEQAMVHWRHQLQHRLGPLSLRWRTCDLIAPDVDDKVDICSMEVYRNQQFDVFICSHVLEHVIDDRRAMQELWRILKPGGWGIVLVPITLTIDKTDEDPTVTDVGERWRRFGQNDHVRRYAKKDFLERLEAAGFRVEQLGIDQVGRRAFRRMGLKPGSVLYVARRDT